MGAGRAAQFPVFRLHYVGMLLGALLLSACRSTPRPTEAAAPGARTLSAAGLAEPRPVSTLDAVCPPPIGWKVEPLKSSERHQHQIWLSPTGRTAYGVIHFTLPLTVPADMVLWAYMNEMKKKEGDAVLISKEKDPQLPGIRFVAEGGLYRTRTNLLVDGRKAWAIYAGTKRAEPIAPAELDLAERAREHTKVGLPAVVSTGN